jgi:undecaprenyl-diphosphatase
MNDAIFYFFYNFAHQSVWLDRVVVFAALYLPFIVPVLAFIYLVFYRKSWLDLFRVFLSAGAAAIISKILKILIHTPRPQFALEGVESLFEKTTYAFPSDHATFFMALAVAIFFVNRKAGLVFFVFALLVGMARIAAGVHFPVDILGGFILGATVAYLAKKI